MTVSFNIELTDLEQTALNERLNRLGLSTDQWAQQIIVGRIDSISQTHKMAKARELFDKFQSAPDDLKQRLMAVSLLKDQGHK